MSEQPTGDLEQRGPVVRAFCALLGGLFLDNTLEDVMTLWALKVEQSAWSSYAIEALACLDAVIADPPPDLIEMMREHGGLFLCHRPTPAAVVPYRIAEHVDWLADVTARLRAAYEAGRSGKA